MCNVLRTLQILPSPPVTHRHVPLAVEPAEFLVQRRARHVAVRQHDLLGHGGFSFRSADGCNAFSSLAAVLVVDGVNFSSSIVTSSRAAAATAAADGDADAAAAAFQLSVQGTENSSCGSRAPTDASKWTPLGRRPTERAESERGGGVDCGESGGDGR
jgi:hypothetical protein